MAGIVVGIAVQFNVERIHSDCCLLRA